MKTILALVLGGYLAAQSGVLPNGVYAVEEGHAKGKNSVVRQHEGKDVVLDTASYAPLTVEGKPVVENGGLSVQLAPEAAKRLESLTRARLNRPIAVVVGDKVLSMPTVRDVIKDGKARVTPCEDDGCSALLRELSK